MEIKLAENSNLVVKDHNGNALCSIDEATGNVTGIFKLYLHQVSAWYKDSNNKKYYINFSVITDNSAQLTSGIINNQCAINFYGHTPIFEGSINSPHLTVIDGDDNKYDVKLRDWTVMSTSHYYSFVGSDDVGSRYTPMNNTLYGNGYDLGILAYSNCTDTVTPL